MILDDKNQNKSSIIIEDLRCEYRRNPLGISNKRPRLSWKLKSTERNQKQTAYRILVASKKDLIEQNIGDLWDSNKIYSNQTNNIIYNGTDLKSRQICWWKVMAWDKDGIPSNWSKISFWTMGLLNKEEFQGKWIFYDTHQYNEDKDLILPPSPYLRKEFSINKEILRGTVYITGLGLFELYINGKRIGNDIFTPGWTDPKHRVYYLTYDVTDVLKNGKNAIGVILGDGWYAGYVGFGLLMNIRNGREYYGKNPALLLQLEIEYQNGETEIIKTDDTWKANIGPIRYSDLLMGEKYDATKELIGWSEPGYDDSEWKDVQVKEEITGSIESYPTEPVRVIKEIKPVEIRKLKDGVFIVDMGQNFAGKIRLRVKGKRGTEIVIRTAEMLNKDGSLMTENLRKARSTDIYILAGDEKEEVWEPHFTYHGFRYIEITGFPGVLDKESITGLVLSSDLEVTGSFECSDELVNQIYRNIVWTQQANFIDIPTDCPQRDERIGWCGDAQIFIKSATYNRDVVTFFEKWITSLNDEQWPDGNYPNYTPDPFKVDKSSSPGWRDAGIICPYTIYKVYNDIQIIEKHYPKMKAFIEFLKNRTDKNLLAIKEPCFGDWLHLGPETPNDLIANLYYFYDLKLMKEMALAIGKVDDAKRCSELSEMAREAFLKKYINENGLFINETQTAYAMALYIGILPIDMQNKAAQRLFELIKEAGWHLDTGFLGIKHLLPALSKFGYNDVAGRLISDKTFPSWGYEILNGATTIWERWDSYTIEKGFQNPEMNSFSHYAFGSVCEWIFGYLAGIDTDGPGFRNIIIKPHPCKQFPFVKAEYDSINGKISVYWEQKDKIFELKVSIPCNVSATIYLPARNPESVEESGKKIDGKDIKFLGMEKGYGVYSVGSGEYHFISF